jgi:hypothetical protein
VRRITLLPPEVAAHRVTFRFTVEPASPLYLRTEFTLEFPPEVRLDTLPERLVWTVFLLCLHSHWTLLCPCRIELPVTLGAGEAEVWSRLLDSYVTTLEAYRGESGEGAERTIEIEESGPRLAPWAPLPAALGRSDLSERAASAFSGGKDSLVQAALLGEISERPLLVTTTSPMPPLHDHTTARRRQVLAAMAARRDVKLVEVRSDFRSSWKNDFPPEVGYPVSVNEITDTFLYLASTLLAGAALGHPRLFLAAEAEVQDNVERAGRVVQHTHFMYSNVTQRAVSSLLRPAGLSYGSLISALPSARVQELLWTRYADLSDLQYSCWRVGPDEAACSRCTQCLRLALATLALGGRPERMGIDLAALFVAQEGWTPRGPLPPDALPRDRVAAGLHADVLRSLRAIPVARVLGQLASHPGRLVRRRTWRAWAAYLRLRERAFGLPAPEPARGYRDGFLDLVEEPFRARLETIFAQCFPRAEKASYGCVLARADGLVRRIVAPLGSAAATVPTPEALAAHGVAVR